MFFEIIKSCNLHQFNTPMNHSTYFIVNSNCRKHPLRIYLLHLFYAHLHPFAHTQKDTESRATQIDPHSQKKVLPIISSLHETDNK